MSNCRTSLRRPPRIHRSAAGLVAALALFGAPATRVLAQAAPGRGPERGATNELSLHTEIVAVYKDGYALFVKRGEARADAQGRVITEEVPDGAILGSFWAVAEGRDVKSMTAEWVETSTERTRTETATTIADLLRANAGREVVLHLAKDETIGGLLVRLLENAPDPTAVSAAPDPNDAYSLSTSSMRRGGGGPLADSATPLAGATVRPLRPEGGDLAYLVTSVGESIVVPVAQIQRVEVSPDRETAGGKGAGLLTDIERREVVARRTKRLTIDLGAEAADKPVVLHLLYFTEGVRWIPAYRLEGSLESEAALALQGEILNEVEDIENATLDLVVGVPNFRFKGVPSPLTLESQLRQTLMFGAGGDPVANSFLNNGMQQVSFAGYSPREEVDEAMSGASELAGDPSMDLFVYKREGFSLKKGARAAVPLWTADVAVEHLYTLDVTVIPNSEADQQPVDSSASPLRVSRNSIWHQLELVNKTDNPWTTGSVLMVRDGLPLGQEMLTYTSRGGRTMLPITVAVDMKGSRDEREVEREPQALRWDNTNFGRITKEGTISVTSYRDEKSRVRVTLDLAGKIESASDEGAIRVDDGRREHWRDARQARVNNSSRCEWNVEVAPGECKELTYRYSYFVY